MAKHTPGKWIIEDVSGFNEIFSEIGTPVCRLAVFSETVTGTPKQDESDANARLIAAAPDMLEMLQSVVDLQANHYGNGIDTHLALIRKAAEIRELIKSATS